MFTAALHAFLLLPSQTTTKRMHTVRSVVKAAMGLAPYEKRILEVIKVGYAAAASLWAAVACVLSAGFAAAWQGALQLPAPGTPGIPPRFTTPMECGGACVPRVRGMGSWRAGGYAGRLL